MRAWILCLVLILAGCTSTRIEKTVWTPELNAGEVDFAKALAHYGQGLILEGKEQNSSSDALAQFKSAAELDSSSYRVQSRVTLETILQGDAGVAVTELRAFCAKNKESFNAWIDLARASMGAGMPDDALSAYKHALTINPTNASLYAIMARTAFHMEDDKDALSFLKDGIHHTDNKKGLLGICHNQGREFIVADKLDRAIPCFEFLIKNSPAGSHQYDYLLGEIYRRLKDNKKAIRYYSLASKQKNPLPDSFIRLAILQEATNAKRSIKTLERGKEKLPDEPLILLALSYAYRDTGRTDDFINAYDEIVEVVSKVEGEELSPEFFLTYASACDEAGRNDAAQKILKNCLEIYPNSTDVLNHLAYMWAQQGVELDQALIYAKRASKSAPDNGAYADTLGWVYYKRGEYKKALKETARANRLIKGHSEIIEHLGDIYFAMGNVSEAVSKWSQVLVRSPGSSELILKLTEQNVNIESLLEESRKAVNNE